MTHPYSQVTSTDCVLAANSLEPFAMYAPLVRSDYYGSSAPPRRHRPTTRLPSTRLVAEQIGDRQGGSRVHYEPIDR